MLGLAPSWPVWFFSRPAGRHLPALYFLNALFVAIAGSAREAAELRTGGIAGSFVLHYLPSTEFVSMEGSERIETPLLVRVFIFCMKD